MHVGTQIFFFLLSLHLGPVRELLADRDRQLGTPSIKSETRLTKNLPLFILHDDQIPFFFMT